MNCIIVDDEEMSRSTVEHFVNLTDFLKLEQVCSSALEAINVLNEKKIDLIFLDIEMPEMSGLEMLETLNYSPAVIFITSKKDYAIQAFDYNVVDYLVKPVEYTRFLKSVNKAMTAKGKKADDSDDTFIKTDLKYVKINFSEVLFVEAMADYVVLNLDAKKHIIHSTMKSLEQKLDSEKFTRVHRSYIVNFTKVDSVENSVIYIGGNKIPIGASYKSEFMQKINLL